MDKQKFHDRLGVTTFNIILKIIPNFNFIQQVSRLSKLEIRLHILFLIIYEQFDIFSISAQFQL